MSQPTHAYYNCTEVETDEILVNEYRDKVYFDILSNGEDGNGIFLSRENIEKLINQLNGWLEKTAKGGE